MPTTDWKEQIPDGEAARLEAMAETLLGLQRKQGGTRRALHAKANACVAADLTVLDNLPAEAKIGIFAQPGSYRGWVRFSNGGGKVASDRRGDVRGIALKLVGVAGKKLIPGMEDAVTQDFLMIRTPTTPIRNAEEFIWLVVAAQNPALFVPRAIFRLGFGRAIRLLKQVTADLGAPMPSVATTRYFSAAPTRFGDFAAKWSLEPHEKPGEGKGTSAEYLHEELAARLAKGPVSWDFRVQYFVDEKQTPIEDTSVEWTSPWTTLARLTLPQQELDSPAGKALAERIEQLSFDPWHAPVEFRPLGNLMRARNPAYRLSTKERGAAPEPTKFE